jgi:hypothetical protein
MKERQMPISRHRKKQETKEGVGLLALGTSGPWEVAIDESLSGPQRRFVQIEGPFVYLYFEITSVEVLRNAHAFLANSSRNARPKSFEKNGALPIAKTAGTQISLTRDDEDNERYFLVIEAKSGLHLQLTVIDRDLSHIVSALRDVLDDLEDAD